MTIDAHQHFWRYSKEGYPWIEPGSPLERDQLPPDLRPLLAAAGIEGCVAVQARQSLEESRWLLSLADEFDFVRGVVGWVDLRALEVDADLAVLAAHPRFRGVRHVVQDEPDDRFLLGADFQRGISGLARHGLTYDLLIYPRQLPAAIELVRAHPRQPFVLDHGAKPEIRAGLVEPWRRNIHELAAAPNVMCKVSGLVTEADHRRWSADQLVAYLDVLFDAFGEDRLMYGSDWPVCQRAATYARQHEVVANYADRLKPAAREKLFGENAARFYGIAD